MLIILVFNIKYDINIANYDSSLNHIMVKIFYGVKLDVEAFCQTFRDFLLQTTTDDVLINIINVIITGDRRTSIINTENGQRARTQYFLGNSPMFSLSEIQTLENQGKFSALIDSFELRFPLQLIVKRERRLEFYIGRELILDFSKPVYNLSIDAETQARLRTILPDVQSSATIYAIKD